MANSLGFPINSFGYAGTIAPNDVWARMQSVLGAKYTVATADAARVTSVAAGTREVKVAPGSIGAYGVLDEITADITVQLPSVASGTEWFLISARRTWGTTQATSIVVTSAGANRAIPARSTTPGTVDDQPLALVPLSAGSTIPGTPVDLRVIGPDRGAIMIAFDELTLSYFNEPGTMVRIGGNLWTRTISPTSYSVVWERSTLAKFSREVKTPGALTIPTSTSTYSNVAGLTFGVPVIDDEQVFFATASLGCVAVGGAGQLLAALSVDGVAGPERLVYEASAGTELTICRTWRLTGLPPGTHTLRVIARSAYGSVQLTANNSNLVLWES